MTRVEFRRRFHVPLTQPFNFFAIAIGMLLSQLLFAIIGMTNIWGLLACVGVLLLFFLVWAGLRIQFKNRLYDEFAKTVNMSFEDFVARVYDVMRR